MRQVQPDLWQTTSFSPFLGLTTHAYLLTRPGGNVLFYNIGDLQELDAIEKLGGVAWQYLSHRDEISAILNAIAERFGSKLAIHIDEAAECSKIRTPDRVYRHRETHHGNIGIIPVPGHSPGSTCFMVSSPTGKKYLFTGDTLYFDSHHGWRAGFIEGLHGEKDRPVLAQSLRLLRELRPDVVLSSAYSGDVGFEEMNPDSWGQKVDRALAELSSESS